MPRTNAVGAYRLDVSYPADQRGWPMDQAIEKLIAKKTWAAGCGFGRRDLSFDFTSHYRLQKAVGRLERAALPFVEWGTWIDEECESA